MKLHPSLIQIAEPTSGCDTLYMYKCKKDTNGVENIATSVITARQSMWNIIITNYNLARNKDNITNHGVKIVKKGSRKYIPSRAMSTVLVITATNFAKNCSSKLISNQMVLRLGHDFKLLKIFSVTSVPFVH